MMNMTQLHRCPRCQREVEGDFCPHCDLHYTSRGVIRPHEDEQPVETKPKSFVEQSEERAKHHHSSVFEKREMQSHPLSEDIFHKTVEEVLQETNMLPKEEKKDDDEPVQQKEQHDNEHREEEKAPRFALKPYDDKATPYTVWRDEKDDQKQEDDSDKAPLPVEFVPDSVDTEEEKTEEKEEQHHNKEAKSEKHDDTPLTPIQQQMKANEKRQKKIIWLAIIVIVLALTVGIGFYFWNQYQEKQQALRETETAIERKIDDFYVGKDENRGFLNKKVTQANTQPIIDNIEQIQNEHPDIAKEMQKKLATLQARNELEQKVNALFVSAKIKGDKVLNPALKEAVDIQLVETKSPKTAFDKAVNRSIKDAKEQQQTMEQANKAVTSLITDGVVSEEASMSDYKKASKKVKDVKNKKVKEKLTKQLDTVKATIEERAEQERLRKEEEKRQEEQARLAKEAKKAQAKAHQDPTNGKSETSSSDPYAWKDGVKEKVINTCINRGYVTSDGYKLEKAYERNGEGYYNLYGTNTRSSLLKGYSSSQLPVYLVTINCKTGWFRGNGSR